MASIFLHHVIGDLTVGKPELAEFLDSETVESAIRAIGDCAEGAITVWRKASPSEKPRSSRAERFVGILNSLDIVAFIAKSEDQEKAMRTPVAEVVIPNPGLLKEVDPGTRLIDALEMMRQGVRRLLVRKSLTWRGVSKRFSILYNGKWLNNSNKNLNDTDNAATAVGQPSSSRVPSDDYKYCCLSREDVIRFLIGCLGALAPVPLSSISSLGAINSHYHHIESSSPAIDSVRKFIPQDPCAVAVVDVNLDGTHKIVGEISAYKLWKCDYLAAAWALANLSAGHFVMGAEDNDGGSRLDTLPDFSILSSIGASPSCARVKKFSSRSVGFFSNSPTPSSVGGSRPAARSMMYRGRSVPLTCKHTSSLAAVMAQMLSHRATHVWVTHANAEEDEDEEQEEETLIGLVSYGEILHAVMKYPSAAS